MSILTAAESPWLEGFCLGFGWEIEHWQTREHRPELARTIHIQIQGEASNTLMHALGRHELDVCRLLSHDFERAVTPHDAECRPPLELGWFISDEQPL
jgi:hypothetical protein